METKKKIGIGIGIILLLVLVILSFTVGKDEDYENEVLSNDYNVVYENANKESDSIEKDEMKDFTKINMETFFKYYQEDQERIILFKRTGCQYCEIAEPILKNLAYRYKLTIYELNTLEVTEEEKNKLYETNEFFKSLGTPTVVIIQNDSIVDSINGLTDRAHYKDLFKKNGFIK